MTTRLIRPTVLLLVLACSLRTGDAALAQPAEPGQVVTPEEMLEDALRKIDNGDFREAQDLLIRVQRLKPELDRIQLVRGLLLIEGNQAAEAIRVLEEYNKSPDANKEYRGFAALGSVYRRSQMFRQAVRPLEQAKDLAPVEVNGKPVRAKIALDLAIVCTKLSDTKRALDAAREAEGLSPNDPEVQYRLAELSQQTNDFPSAIRAIGKSVTLIESQLRANPYEFRLYLLLKQVYELQSKIATAQRSVNPDDPEPYFLIADATYNLGRTEQRISALKAREYVLEAVAKDPKQDDWKVFLSQLEFELGAYQDALDRLNELLTEKPDHAAANALRARIQGRLQSTPAQ